MIIDEKEIEFDSAVKNQKQKSILTRSPNREKSIDNEEIKDSNTLNNYSNNIFYRPDDKIKMKIQKKSTFVKNNYDLYNYQIDTKTIAYYLSIYGSLCCVKKAKNINEESRIIKEMLGNFLELLDINTYLKINKDIELMKYLFINQDENILIGILEKPSISKKKASLFQMMTTLKQNTLEKKKTEEFWKQFSQLLYQKDKNEFERKLCYLVCSEISDLIEVK